MHRRPSAREGVMVPHELVGVMVLAVVAGVAAVGFGERLNGFGPFGPAFGTQLVEVGYWVTAGAGLALLSAGLMFWQVGKGLLVSVIGWLGFAGAVALRVSLPGGAGGWLIAAGALTALCAGLVSLNRTIGSGIAAGAWLVFAGLLMRKLPASVSVASWWVLVLIVGVLLVVAMAARVVFSRSSSRGLLRRLGRAGRETDGLASWLDVSRTSSARVMRKKMTRLRPSLAGLSRWARRKVANVELGVRIARVGFVSVWSSCQDHTITFGGPRKGKTQQVMNYILDAPGAVITTSTKQDVMMATATARAVSGPVWLFDPSGVVNETDGRGGPTDGAKLIASVGVQRVRFDPLAGCEVAAVAMDRAADLIDGVGRDSNDGRGERWDGFAKQTLQALLHAAALGPYTMNNVQEWVAHPNKDAELAVTYELRAAGASATGMLQEATQFFRNNPDTQSSISTTIMPALSWLSVATAAASAAPGGQQFDVAELIASGGTVYLIGKDDKKTAPLVTALTAYIARQAQQIAAGMPGERLDPQLTMVLDEAALICLIPLDQWSGDFGSRGITLHIAAQSRAQMRQRFGDEATGSLLTNCATKVLYGGCGDDDDLNYWSTLAGEREEPAVTRDQATGNRSVSTRKSSVLTPAQVGQLRAGQILIISDGMPPAITKGRMTYKRRDVRLARFRARRDVQALVRFTTEQVLPHVARASHAMATTVRVTARRVFGPVIRRGDAALTWLDRNDPVREFRARIVLRRSGRKASAALDTRSTTPRELTDAPTGTDHSDQKDN
ncbi:type IV secretory system conjugative DNA transfer family protein [Kribbella sp. NPDC056951]|uniref:type IV secretory system conjugative DNA transfer family protein n=1 Tax=Kribbella sp. NPDC056951 TaxID=3345978 RepID=UPI003637CF75